MSTKPGEGQSALTASLAWDGKVSVAVREARAALEAAEEAVEHSRENAATHLVAVALGEAPAPSLTVRDAIAQRDEAAARKSAAEDAKGIIQRRLAGLESPILLAKSRVAERAIEVIRAEVRPMAEAIVAELERLHREYDALNAAAGWLLDNGAIEGPLPHGLSPNGSHPWRAALVALQADANATIPLDTVLPQPPAKPGLFGRRRAA